MLAPANVLHALYQKHNPHHQDFFDGCELRKSRGDTDVRVKMHPAKFGWASIRTAHIVHAKEHVRALLNEAIRTRLGLPERADVTRQAQEIWTRVVGDSPWIRLGMVRVMAVAVDELPRPAPPAATEAVRAGVQPTPTPAAAAAHPGSGSTPHRSPESAQRATHWKIEDIDPAPPASASRAAATQAGQPTGGSVSSSPRETFSASMVSHQREALRAVYLGPAAAKMSPAELLRFEAKLEELVDIAAAHLPDALDPSGPWPHALSKAAEWMSVVPSVTPYTALFMTMRNLSIPAATLLQTHMAAADRQSLSENVSPVKKS